MFVSNGLPAWQRTKLNSRPQTARSYALPQRPGTYWGLNGSVMYLEAVVATGLRKFYYVQPSSEMVQAGVQPGSLFFEGQRRGNKYEGKAYVVKRCGNFGFQVNGDVVNDETVIPFGSAPRVNSSCSITGYQSENSNYLTSTKLTNSS